LEPTPHFIPTAAEIASIAAKRNEFPVGFTVDGIKEVGDLPSVEEWKKLAGLNVSCDDLKAFKESLAWQTSGP